jgi:hypothetical protein
MDFAKLLDRVKNILTNPKAEWPVIAAEPATVQSLFLGYALPLAGAAALAGLIGNAIFGLGVVYGVVGGIVGLAVGLGLVYVMGIVASALAKSFSGDGDLISGLKLVVYCSTPGWVLGLSAIVPMLAAIAGIVALIWSIFLLYTGAGPVMNVPAERSGGYTAVLVILWIVVYIVAAVIIFSVLAATVGTAMLTGAAAMGG